MKLAKVVQKIDYDFFKVVVVDEHYCPVTDFPVEKIQLEEKTFYKFPGCTLAFYEKAKVECITPNVDYKTRLACQIDVRVMSDERETIL